MKLTKDTLIEGTVYDKGTEYEVGKVKEALAIPKKALEIIEYATHVAVMTIGYELSVIVEKPRIEVAPKLLKVEGSSFKMSIALPTIKSFSTGEVNQVTVTTNEGIKIIFTQ